ncbi:MAG: hypothetical protein GTO02_20120 [Candidatus Dadabacteria bacterium]|nr:hypothetical protein [Candidatus Dadabacteria bacterium]NIQ16604.1 hypothetical protein [Candidatus Dadabacteria bacterium]
MEVIGKLFAIFLLTCTIGVGTIYVLENGFFSSVDGEDITVSTSIDEAINIRSYRKKLRDEYEEFTNSEKVVDEIHQEDTENVLWKYEYTGSDKK